MVDLEDSPVDLCLILTAGLAIPKTAGLAGLAGLLNLLLQGFADFGEILDFICRTLKTRQFCLRCYQCIWQLYFLLPSTRLVFMFFNWKPGLRQDRSETLCRRINLKLPAAFSLIKNCVSVSANSYRFQNLVGFEWIIKRS